MTASTVNQSRCHAAHTAWGGLTRLELDGLSMLQYPATPAESGAGGVWLRLLDGASATPLRVDHPAAANRLIEHSDGFELVGEQGGLSYSCRFSLHPREMAWQWLITVANSGFDVVEVDAVMTADIALAAPEIVRINQFYVSQYLDLTALSDQQHGFRLAVRQNMPGPRSPWVLLGGYGRVVGWATDGAQLGPVRNGALTGLGQRELPGRRLQHEHTLAVLSDQPVVLAPGELHRTGFFGQLVPDHPEATDPSEGDGGPAEPLPLAPTSDPSTLPIPAPGLFATATEPPPAPLSVRRLAELVAGPVEVTETSGDQWWEAETAAGEVLVSAAKQGAVLRPHGHILRTGRALSAETACLTSTVWMDGVFGSQLTRGQVGRHPFVTTRQGYLGLQRSQGVRIFVRRPDGWRLLGRPSAWGLRPGAARWLYALDDLELQVTCVARTDEHVMELVVQQASGEPVEVLVAVGLSTDLAVGHDGSTGWADGPGGRLRLGVAGMDAAVGDGSALVPGRPAEQPWLTVRARLHAPLRLSLEVQPASAAPRISPAATVPGDPWATLRDGLQLTLTGGPAANELARLNRILPWFGHNALVHYLSPRGLEQFSGGGWGTRDVCQGPVGLLTAYSRPDALRDLLLRVFAAQHQRGDWPQAFDFLPPQSTGQPDAHGDVPFWPLLALGDYLTRWPDPALLGEELPFVGDEGRSRPASLLDHLDRALTVIEQRGVPGTPLPAYGHGDWNDSLQPADPGLAARMVSAWTATLQVQALRALAVGLRACEQRSGTVLNPAHADAGLTDLAARAADLADATAAAVQGLLVVDGLLAGYAVFDDAGSVEELLVHPRDRRTGLHYGVLPWIHAITADLLSPEQARDHLKAIETHLLGVDGARLFDAPPPYRGGPMTVFQRAEAATFWGREIGLMYTHAHLRYAEALARVGDAQGLFRALNLANPIGVTERVPGAAPRQSTCYYSSSDAAFADRADAARRYPESLTGASGLNGGWRVYSSGPGLFLRLVVECLLGVRRQGDALVLDPVLDADLDGLRARVPLDGSVLDLEYRVRAPGYGVRSVTIDGRPVEFEALTNGYRDAGARVPLAALDGAATIEVEVGDA